MSNKLSDNMDAAAEMLSILGNGKRLLIMYHLLRGEMSVGTIAGNVDLSQSALSQHLAKLRKLDLVTTRREKQTIYYSCKSDRARALLRCLDEIFESRPDRNATARRA